MKTVVAAVDTAERASGQVLVQPLYLEALTLAERLHRGFNRSTVQTRQSCTTSMINMLRTGANNRVLADTNPESANVLALQPRLQLSTAALSVANQAVLRLLG